MSKLEELIDELCPRGIRFIALNTICEIYDGTHQTPNYTDSGVKFVSVENIGDLYSTYEIVESCVYTVNNIDIKFEQIIPGQYEF